MVKQLVVEFAKKENIKFDGNFRAEILLGRDTRPSGESLLEAAKRVKLSLPEKKEREKHLVLE